MTDAFQPINYCLFKGILILFVLPKELEKSQFEQLIRLLQEKAGAELTEASLSAYWQALQERMAGNSRWDKVSPVVEPESRPDWRRRAHLSLHRPDNIPNKRPYVSFMIRGVQYVVDVFNPRNELNLQYPGAGGPVLALIMRDEKVGNIEDKLLENVVFYEIIRGIATICNAGPIVGMNSGDLASLMRAYFEKTIDPSADPWSFLYPLQVIKLPKHVGDVALKRYFAKVEEWGDGRLLLQVKPGIDFTINRQNAEAAMLLGMTPVQNLNPDMMKQNRS